MKESGTIVSSTPLARAPYPPLRGPPSPMGKATIREHRFSRHNAFPDGEGKEEAASPQKRKPTPPRCARQPLPREGAREVMPGFLWKEVPRRGGGWMGKAVSPTQSLPRVGKVASGASRIGQWRYEKEWGNASQVDDIRKHPIHRWRGPPSPMGKATKREYRFSRIVKANTRICGEKQYRRTKPSPRGEGGERSEPDRVLAG